MADIDFDTRQWVLDALEEHIPVNWRLIPYDASLDNIGTEPVVMLHLDSLAPHPQSTFDNHVLQVTYKLTVIEPKQAPGTRDQALDNKVIQLIEGIARTDGLVFEGADSALYRDKYISYVLTLTAPLDI